MSSERHQATSAAEQDISVFWEANPCGDSQVGGLEERFGGDFNRFFSEYDAFRYRREKHILPCLDRANFAGKKVSRSGWAREQIQSRSFAAAAAGPDWI